MLWRRLFEQVSLIVFVLLPAAFLGMAEYVIGVSSRYYIIPLFAGFVGVLVWIKISLADDGNQLSRDDFFKLLSLVGTAIAAIAITGGFFESSKREQQKNFHQLAVENCLEAIKVNASFASTTDPSKIDKDIYKRFWQAFYGPLILTENKEVHDEMVAVARTIIEHVGDGENKCWNKDQVIEFQEHAVNVAAMCRKQINSDAISLSDFVPQQFLLPDFNKSVAPNVDEKMRSSFPGDIGEVGNKMKMCPQTVPGH